MYNSSSKRRPVPFRGPAGRYGGVSPRTVRCALGTGLLALCGLFFYLSTTLLKKQAAAPAAEDDFVPEYGQAYVDGLLDQKAPAGGDDQQRALRAGGGEQAPEAGLPNANDVPAARRKRRIILSTGEGKWNTGVWPAWGGDDPTRSVLNWAAAGTVVEKPCAAKCIITHDQSDIENADAVVMELINHPKFGYGDNVPIPWPAKRDNPKAAPGLPRATAIPPKLPLVGLFYYEAARSYPSYTLQSATVREKIDFSMTPDQSSTMPVSMTCPWGRSTEAFLAPAPAKKAEHLLAYFNEHGVAPEYRQIVDEFFQAAGDKMHSYIHRRNRNPPEEAGGNPYQLSRRLDFLGTYKFHLVTEPIQETDWIEPELSQTFVAGAVPIYIGAPNVLDYVPGPRSMIHIRDFPSGKALWEFVSSFDSDSEEAAARYKEFFAWKNAAMEAYMSDEGRPNQIGTGAGLVRTGAMSPAALRKQLQMWAADPAPDALEGEPAEAEDDDGTGSKVAALAELRKRRGLENGVLPFDKVAQASWRNFRRQLDRCVHYAECRLCDYVTLMT